MFGKIRSSMNHDYKKKFKIESNYIYILSFFIPITILVILYIGRGIYPFGNSMYLARDMYHQYAPFFSEFYNKLREGGSLTYSWNIGGGTNFLGLYAYYLASPINWLLVFVKREHLIEVMNIIIILKIAFSSVTFTYYLSKHFKAKNILMVVISIVYGLSSYTAAFSWNLMWLDCMVLLPLIVLGLECLVKENKCFLYSISLGLAILSNYYIAFMICIFSVLYFCVLLFSQKEKEKLSFYKQRLFRFVIFSLIAGGFAAFLIIPEYFALKVSASGDINFPEELKRYFSIYEMVSRGLMNVEISASTDHDPNLYSTVAVFLLLPLYWMRKSSNKKEKIGKTLLVVIFLLSFNFNIPNYIWHGFHFPNSLACRQSFIFIFLILSMSYEAFHYIKSFTDRQIYSVFAGALALFLSFEYFLVNDAYQFGIVYISGIFLALYLLAIQRYRHSREDNSKFFKIPRSKFPAIFIVLIFILEIVINYDATGLNTVGREYYTDDNKAIGAMLSNLEEKDDSFYRIEKVERRTKNDAAWHQYKGVSAFSSTSQAGLNDFLELLGFETSMNAYSFYGYTPLTASLFSVKYMFGKEMMEPSNLESLYTQSGEEYLYKNNYTLPLGFMIPEDFEERWYTNNENPFLVQNNFVHEILGEETYEEESFSGEDDISYATTSRVDLFNPIVTNNYGVTATLNVQDDNEVFIYISTKDLENLKISIMDVNGIEISAEDYDDYIGERIHNLGKHEPGSVIHISTEDDISNIELYAYSLNEDVFLQTYEELVGQPFEIHTFEDTYIQGNIFAETDGIMYTSIPYDKGWKVTVDGNEVKSIAFKEALLAIPLSQGEHTVELSYRPEGLKVGIFISGISVLAFLAIAIVEKLKDNRNK